jgi:hypothetical protein
MAAKIAGHMHKMRRAKKVLTGILRMLCTKGPIVTRLVMAAEEGVALHQTQNHVANAWARNAGLKSLSMTSCPSTFSSKSFRSSPTRASRARTRHLR